MPFFPRHVPAILAAMTLGSYAFADLVHLSDGRILDGTITSEPGAEVLVMRMSLGGDSHAIVTVDPADIRRIDIGPSARERAITAIWQRRQALGDGGSSEQWMRLAQEAKGVADMTLARDLASIALSRDRDDEAAHRLLGHVRQNGTWMTATEAAVARGEIRFRGRWMPEPEMRSILASEEEARRAAEVDRQHRLASIAEADALARQTPAVSAHSRYGWSGYRSGTGYGHGSIVFDHGHAVTSTHHDGYAHGWGSTHHGGYAHGWGSTHHGAYAHGSGSSHHGGYTHRGGGSHHGGAVHGGHHYHH